MNTQQLRFNMIEQQIRPWNVLDPLILSRLDSLHREDYVPKAYQSMAFADIEIPLNSKSKMWSPKMQARVVQDLSLRADDVVVEVGTGSGYQTALMASLCKQVLSYEIDADLAKQAAANLKSSPNAQVFHADGLQANFGIKPTVLVFTGALAEVPLDCLKQMSDKVRVFAVLGQAPVMRASLLTRNSPNAPLASKVLFETVIEPLQGVKSAATFQF